MDNLTALSPLIETAIRDALWVLVIGGWGFLILTGLEADKPLSGGLPGHLPTADDQASQTKNSLDRLGEVGAWVLFGLMAASLPVILWWIFAVHPR